VDVRGEHVDQVDGVDVEGEGDAGKVMSTITGVGNKSLAFANRKTLQKVVSGLPILIKSLTYSTVQKVFFSNYSRTGDAIWNHTHL
jgi:hypothetical protein